MELTISSIGVKEWFFPTSAGQNSQMGELQQEVF
jgi:hypothetical protein